MCFNTGCRLSKCPFQESPARKRKVVKRIGSIRHALQRGRNCDFGLSDRRPKALCASVQRFAAALTVPLANGSSNAATWSHSRPDSIGPNAAGVLPEPPETYPGVVSRNQTWRRRTRSGGEKRSSFAAFQSGNLRCNEAIELLAADSNTASRLRRGTEGQRQLRCHDRSSQSVLKESGVRVENVGPISLTQTEDPEPPDVSELSGV
jgi:hypothetical protein